VLERNRGDVAVPELCRREGIHTTIYYKWLRDFIEAGKGRVRGDTKREPTSEEVRQVPEENERLKLLVAELGVANLTLKKSLFQCYPKGSGMGAWEWSGTTKGKLERFHETLKVRLNLLVYTSPEALREVMAEFIGFYKYGPYCPIWLCA
jgi:transposase-like protein